MTNRGEMGSNFHPFPLTPLALKNYLNLNSLLPHWEVIYFPI